VCATTLQFPHYRARDPGPSEVLLLVEVADTTLDFDTTTKAGLYARAGIADYWVLDVNKSRIIVHREPVGGEYRSLTVYESEEPVSPLAAPEASFRWTDMETE
jgi:Uma2 family endonuclease